jgi:hypothetical protein
MNAVRKDGDPNNNNMNHSGMLIQQLIPSFIPWNITSCIRCGFPVLQTLLFYVFVQINEVSSEESVNLGSSLLSWTDWRYDLENLIWLLDHLKASVQAKL